MLRARERERSVWGVLTEGRGVVAPGVKKAAAVLPCTGIDGVVQRSGINRSNLPPTSPGGDPAETKPVVEPGRSSVSTAFRSLGDPRDPDSLSPLT